MHLDWNLMRAVLLAVERGEDPAQIPGADAKAVEYHLFLLGTDRSNAGWITVPRCAARTLTDNGKAVASLIREEGAWRRICSYVRSDLRGLFHVLFRLFLAKNSHAPLHARREALGLSIQDVIDATHLSMRTAYRCEELNRLPRSVNDRAAYLKALMWTEAEAQAAITAAKGRIHLDSLAPQADETARGSKQKRAHADRLRKVGAR